MNYIEKVGLIMIIVYFSVEWVESLKGAEVVLGMIGSILFLGGEYIQSWITAFQEV